MKRPWILPAAALAAALLLASPPGWSAPDPSAYEADPVHSFVLFKARHLGASWAYGRFNELKASIQVDEAKPELSSVSFEVKAESVDTGVAKRDQHLRSPDFLNAKQFPAITFKSSKVVGAGKDAVEVTGDLTLHGVTKSITVKVEKVGAGKGMKGEELMGFETTFTIKRSEYGMTTMLGPVSDEITLTVAVESARK